MNLNTCKTIVSITLIASATVVSCFVPDKAVNILGTSSLILCVLWIFWE